MESLIAFSIKHGKFFNFIALTLAAVGLYVFISARKDFIPPVKEAYVTVKVVYPGASPESVRQEIVSRIEEKTAEIPDIEKSSSISKKNVGLIKLSVRRSSYKNLQNVLQKVQDKVRAIKFPEIARAPEFSTYDLAEDLTVLSIHIAGDTRTYEISRELELALRQLEGLNALTVSGREDYNYAIDFDPDVLARRGIALAEAMQAVRQAIPDIPGGEILTGGINQNITLQSSFDSIPAIENIVLRANEEIMPLRIKDLAQVRYAPKKKEVIRYLNGREGIVFDLSKTSGRDILRFTRDAKNIIQTFQLRYSDISFSLFNDRSVAVESRLSLLNSNLSYGLIFVFIVLVLFMSFSTSFWTVMGIPISFAIGAIVSVLLCGVTINVISMVGFIVVLGIVVDDAIVFSENAYRYLENGFSPYDAVVKGMAEVLPSVCFAIYTTVGAVVCMFLIGGKIGDFARPMIIILAITLSASLIEAIFVLPGHLVRSFQKRKTLHESEWRRTFYGFFYTPYRSFLGFILKWRKTSLAVFLVLAFTTMTVLFLRIPFVFYGGPPKTVLVQMEASPGTPLEETSRLAAPLEALLRNDPNLEHVHTLVGVLGDSHKAEIQGAIKTNVSPRYNWNTLKSTVLARGLESEGLASTRFYITREDSLTTDLINITVKGTDDTAVKSLAETIRTYTAGLPNVQNPRLSTASAGEEIRITLDPAKSYAYGLSPRYIAQHISMAFQGTAARTLARSGQEIDLYLQYAGDARTLETLSNLKIPNKYARFVSLSSLAAIDSVPAESEITTEGGLFSVHILDTLQNVDVLSNNSFAVQGSVQKAFAGKGNSTAAAYFDNEQKDTNESLVQMLLATILSVLVIFALLLFMFDSYLHTAIILMTIPFIGVGVSIGLSSMKLPLTNMALTGSIALLGMVVNDGIVILEFLRAHTQRGIGFTDAVIDGTSLRLRSIMMTTGTTVFGIMPVALGFSGNEFFLQPLAVAMMFGILFNSLITLVFLPLIVTILELDFKNTFTKSLKSSYVGLLLFLLPVGTVFGQETLSNLMTESQFLNLYLDQAFQPRIYGQAALGAKEAEKSAYAPYAGSFFAQASAAFGTATNTFPVQNISMGGMPLSADLTGSFTNASASLGFDASIYPSGTYLKIEGGADFANQSSTLSSIVFAPIPSVQSTNIRERYAVPYFQVTLAQPFLKNGFAYNMHKKRVSLARNEAGANLLQERLRLEESVLDALSKFHALILNVRILALRKESLLRMNKLLESQRTLMRAGARSQWDIRQIEMMQKKLQAGAEILSISLEKDFTELESRMGIFLNRSNLGFLDYCIAADTDYNSSNICALALARNSDLAKVRLLAENARAGADIIRNQSLPELNLALSYKYASRSAFENIANVSEDRFYARLQFQMPLAYNAERAKNREAQYRAQKALLERQNYESEISYAALTRASDWSSVQRDLAAKEEIALLAQQVAEEARIRWQNAEISLNEFFTHEENYRQAKIDLELRRFDAKRLALGIRLLQGDLLETYQISE